MTTIPDTRHPVTAGEYRTPDAVLAAAAAFAEALAELGAGYPAPEPEPAFAVETVPDLRAFSVLDAAAMLGVSKHYVYSRITAGEIRTVDLGEGRAKTRITAAELRRFLNSRTETAA